MNGPTHMEVPVVYIAGPMRGIPRFNFDAFHDAEARALKQGWAVINPAAVDEALGFDPDQSKPSFSPEEIRTYIVRDLGYLSSTLKAEMGDAIGLLPGWNLSTGARAEEKVARWAQLRVLCACEKCNFHEEIPEGGTCPAGTPAPQELAQKQSRELPEAPKLKLEAVLTDSGSKFDSAKSRVDLLSGDLLLEAGYAMTYGASKYGVDNYRGGIQFRRLLGAALRHLLELLEGRDDDPESGLKHEAHVVANMSMLAVMRQTRPDLDDRPVVKGRR